MASNRPTISELRVRLLSSWPHLVGATVALVCALLAVGGVLETLIYRHFGWWPAVVVGGYVVGWLATVLIMRRRVTWRKAMIPRLDFPIEGRPRAIQRYLLWGLTVLVCLGVVGFAIVKNLERADYLAEVIAVILALLIAAQNIDGRLGAGNRPGSADRTVRALPPGSVPATPIDDDAPPQTEQR